MTLSLEVRLLAAAAYMYGTFLEKFLRHLVGALLPPGSSSGYT